MTDVMEHIEALRAFFHTGVILFASLLVLKHVWIPLVNLFSTQTPIFSDCKIPLLLLLLVFFENTLHILY
ncbi:hypothetical protein PRIPAC_70315 [Pristionchus pacificus]|uniref:Uncharacterized protein n=1 Tax=Pristionchus pacificus TaxID=54126 RepID=A0A2A6CF36_PRIPA|nr:hypothetical protein PRIPAC_70315 [Pristionchus pacificus]|eukprot:PDM76710.1 hypothetical protein PRIPAC_42105 [Pristionchus pacificus]